MPVLMKATTLPSAVTDSAVNRRRLRQLPFAEQLFVWTVRHRIYAREMQRPVHCRVQQAFDVAGLPGAVQAIERLLDALSSSCIAPVIVNVPAGIELLADERRLVACLHALLEGRCHRAREPLDAIVWPQSMRCVMDQFVRVAGLLSAYQIISGARVKPAADEANVVASAGALSVASPMMLVPNPLSSTRH